MIVLLELQTFKFGFLTCVFLVCVFLCCDVSCVFGFCFIYRLFGVIMGLVPTCEVWLWLTWTTWVGSVRGGWVPDCLCGHFFQSLRFWTWCFVLGFVI